MCLDLSIPLPVLHPLASSLVQSKRNVATNACRQVNFRLKVQLDSNQQGSILQLAVFVDWSFDDVACWAVEAGRRRHGPNLVGDLAAAAGLTVGVGVGSIAGRADGRLESVHAGSRVGYQYRELVLVTRRWCLRMVVEAR